MDMAAPIPQVLVIGLDPYRVPGPWDPKPVADAIEAGMARFAAHGVGVETCLFGLDGSDDVLAVVTAALQARPWTCVVIGGGVRDESQLDLFEQVLNLVRRHAPGAAIAFNRTPSDTFDAARRWIELPEPASGGSVAHVAVIARVTVREGKADEYLAAFAPLLEQAEREPGTLVYAVHRSNDDPNVFCTTEVYADDAAFATHRSSDVHAAAAPVFTELIAAADFMIGETLMAKGLGG
jgi:quinol monooxygenase YgiN